LDIQSDKMKDEILILDDNEWFIELNFDYSRVKYGYDLGMPYRADILKKGGRRLVVYFAINPEFIQEDGFMAYMRSMLKAKYHYVKQND